MSNAERAHFVDGMWLSTSTEGSPRMRPKQVERWCRGSGRKEGGTKSMMVTTVEMLCESRVESRLAFVLRLRPWIIAEDL